MANLGSTVSHSPKLAAPQNLIHMLSLSHGIARPFVRCRVSGIKRCHNHAEILPQAHPRTWSRIRVRLRPDATSASGQNNLEAARPPQAKAQLVEAVSQTDAAILNMVQQAESAFHSELSARAAAASAAAAEGEEMEQGAETEEKADVHVVKDEKKPKTGQRGERDSNQHHKEKKEEKEVKMPTSESKTNMKNEGKMKEKKKKGRMERVHETKKANMDQRQNARKKKKKKKKLDKT